MITKILFPIWIIFSFVLLSCKEQTVQPISIGAIRGQVLDHETGIPIKGASITTSPPTNAILTNNNGEFLINDCSIGNYTVSVTKNNYKKNSVTISVIEEKESTAIIYLEKEIINLPNAPENPYPNNSATGQPVSIKLSWGNENNTDEFTFDLYLYKTNSASSEPLIIDLSDTTFNVTNLDYNTTYYWQVASKDTSGNKAFSQIWNFTTMEFPSYPFYFASYENNNYDIFSSDSLQSIKVQLTNFNGKEWWARINRNRKKIAFVSDLNIENQIFTMDMDGKNIQQVTSLPIAGYHNNGIGFCWSPNGEFLLYCHYDKLYQIRYDGTELKQIAIASTGRNFRECAYSPDNSKIAVLTIGVNSFDSEIYLMNSDGSDMSLLVDNLPGSLGGLDFSIDGKNVLFTHDVSGNEVIDGKQLDSHIKLINIISMVVSDLSSNKKQGTNDLYPQFSPDGSKIIFTNQVNDNSQLPAIYIMNSDGESRALITNNGLMPDWK